MDERRKHVRYRLTPPLAGRVFIDAIGQYDARLLDVSVEGARLLLMLKTTTELERFLAAGEKGITGVFSRDDGSPWKFVLLHTRMSTVDADAGASAACEIGGRFVAVPSFGADELHSLLAVGQAAVL